MEAKAQGYLDTQAGARPGVNGTAIRTARIAKRFGKFCVVGSSGVVVNTLVLYLLHERFVLPLVIASPIAVEMAILNNFFWNNYWTFGQEGARWVDFGRFNLVALGGLAITTLILVYLSEGRGMFYLLANLAAIAVATTWNFAVNSLWTWNSR